MENNLLGTNLMMQVGILVHDIEKTGSDFAAVLGMERPGWSWTGTLEQAQTEYRGKPSEARAKLMFFSVGQCTIELIEPDEHPSTWREDLDKNGEGVHHLAFTIKGMKEVVARFEANGMKLIQKGEYTGGRYAYLDSNKQLKTLIELLEND
ncbi:MAG: VOC family protein [Clostridiales bacterium]|jgi:catechol 2,3-dioxygenase-like lactoylglutathione lyase family enzyme|nr:VOC family protein [Clostridiales bacterium]